MTATVCFGFCQGAEEANGSLDVKKQPERRLKLPLALLHYQDGKLGVSTFALKEGANELLGVL